MTSDSVTLAKYLWVFLMQRRVVRSAPMYSSIGLANNPYNWRKKKKKNQCTVSSGSEQSQLLSIQLLYKKSRSCITSHTRTCIISPAFLFSTKIIVC